MWKNIVEPDRSQMSIWRMRTACWIPRAKNAHSGYVIVNSSPLQQWLHERASLLSYMCIACSLINHVLQVRCKAVQFAARVCEFRLKYSVFLHCMYMLPLVHHIT